MPMDLTIPYTLVAEEATFRVGQRVRIISSGTTATIKAAFTLVPGYYYVRFDDSRNHRIAFETELEVLEHSSERWNHSGHGAHSG